MDITHADHLLETKHSLWIVVGLLLVLFLTANLPWQLDDYDQAKQAFTSFEMVREGHWLYQHTPQERIATKPPLVGWMSAVFFVITRSWDVAWRSPSFLAAIGISVFLWRTARLAYGSIAGLFALGAVGFNLLTPRLATLVRTDLPLALMIFLIGLLIWQKIRARQSWTAHDRLSMFALLTAAMLIKGPIVYAFLLPGIVLFHLCGGGIGGLRRSDAAARRPYHGAWCGWWPWLASLGVFLAWVIGGILSESDFFSQVVMREFLTRFGATVHHSQTFFFYIPHLLHRFFPWSVLMIALVVADLRARRWRIHTAPHLWDEISPETFWLICWIFGGLIVMSIIPSKRVDRIFPIVPPLCLLLAAQISGGVGALRRPDAAPRRPYLVAALLLAILFTGGYAIWKVVSGYRDHRNALVEFGWAVRDEAGRHHWRYEAITSPDEGMLLYLQKTHFVDPKRAIVEWNGGNLDAVVAPADDTSALMPQLRGAEVSQLAPARRKDQRHNYVLITRSR